MQQVRSPEGVEYRPMSRADEEAMLDLWIETWGGANRDFARWEMRSDPGYLEHSFVASTLDGTILATSHYYLQRVRDASGTPRLAGCLSHVATRESARRQGHARKVVEMAHQGMRRDGCAYALLFSSDIAVQLYEGLGYAHLPSPYWRALLSAERPQAPDYIVRRFDPSQERGGWDLLASIHSAYDGQRPMSVVRDSINWEIVARRFFQSFDDHIAHAYVASIEGNDSLIGYAFAHFSTVEMARKTFDLDQVFTISELGVLPGHERAVSALLSTITDAVEPGKVGGRAFLPREAPVIDAVRTIFGETLHDVDDRRIMALPLSGEIDYEDLQAMARAPGAWFWFYDAF